MTAIKVTLPDGTEREVIEVEFESHWEGSGHLAREVPYVTPVDWRQGGGDLISPHKVRLFALIETEPGGS